MRLHRALDQVQSLRDLGASTAAGPRTAAPAGPAGAGALREPAERLAEVRAAARRRSVPAFAAPAVAAVFFVPAAVFLAWQLTTGVLPPSAFDRLETGRPVPSSPRCSRTGRSGTRPAMSGPPPGRRTRSARSTAPADFYRLCRRDDVLVAKDTMDAKRR
ncbi:hypothetical protein [Streptomyces sp. NRRL F-4428]|uniref:hypothetical protein n=1 Tax=Streptomyces sp. NRRL F-4428 TaxID=1609137 RepID=UPI0005ECE44F|nr:hypothetical protein [Streptomyces sp. NRRL F-4428]KJK52199.1 hypothetical protein UK14_09440 [Streptomyces sp. NRRL F-4428]